ncbi:AraC family 4-hydroxyphenylacetate 3-monooxygenase operon regulatory protein [Catalinimonas alkaloidigena]|uniref:AraC family transcriptional regulator n=1 Tax=Catalinimonas alkaloidigena TaxID=1075417 RepID=UPI002405A256|nr:helix-turn-helix domain-containing protein [Catalinimonas alkaloidigena]MDF9795082.1 AraC family 4-hydroxyphenylacetate 3-monooxygenase operon regulatory protein [Catalinimonas alkaloidigena]
MLYTYQKQDLGSFFCISTDFSRERIEMQYYRNLIYIFWNRTSEPIHLYLDAVPHSLQPGQLSSCTYLQHISFDKNTGPLTAFAFNREFYCIQDHDHEVSCNGILFFGAQQTPLISLDEQQNYSFNLLYQVFLEEFQTKDNIQGEMLRMLLKRLIIKTTRLAKAQLLHKKTDNKQIDIIRKFNVLVDMHFREKHQVSDYADLLFKSPKTLSNLFAQFHQQTPLEIIHHRIILEAKRLLLYTDKPFKQIAYELGYKEVASFHKLFKRITKQTPQQYRNKLKEKEV